MAGIAGLKGMRHIALKVRNAARATRFYRDVPGMEIVWQPDRPNVYHSSGWDNIEIHEVPLNLLQRGEERQLAPQAELRVSSGSKLWSGSFAPKAS